MLDANLIMVSLIISLAIFGSIKCICDATKVVSQNRKEEAEYKLLEKKILKDLYEQGYKEEDDEN